MKKPIAVILTDTHLKESNISLVYSIFKQAIEHTKKLGLKELYHGGDIFDSRRAQTVELLTAFKDIVEMCKENKIRLIAIPGNHDKVSYTSYHSFLDSFGHYPLDEIIDPYFRLVSKYDAFSLTEDVAFHMIPFFEDKMYIENLQEYLVGDYQKKKKKKNILLTHIGFSSAIMNSGTIIEGQISEQLISKFFDLTLVGHFHDYQELYGGSVTYIGSGYQGSHGEDEKKGITVVYDTLEIEQIQLEFPKYRTLKLQVENLTQKDIEDINLEKQTTGDNIKVVLIGEETKVKSFNKQQLLNVGVKVEIETEKVSRIEVQESVEKFDSSSILSYFKEFCIRKNFELDKGLDYLKKVV